MLVVCCGLLLTNFSHFRFRCELLVLMFVIRVTPPHCHLSIDVDRFFLMGRGVQVNLLQLLYPGSRKPCVRVDILHLGLSFYYVRLTCRTARV